MNIGNRYSNDYNYTTLKDAERNVNLELHEKPLSLQQKLKRNGVAMKVTMITAMISLGFGQGIQPLLGYCVGAKLWERFKEVMRFSVILTFFISVVLTGLCYLFASQLVGAFLTDSVAFDYVVQFVYILLSTSFIFGVFFAFTNALQAMGAATASLIVNLCRQGIIYIPAIFILSILLGVSGLVWAQPVADIISTIVVILLYKRTLTKMMKSKNYDIKKYETATAE